MKITCINYIFSEKPLSKRQIKRFYKIGNTKMKNVSVPTTILSTELKLSEWYLYTLEADNHVPLTEIIKPYHFKDTIIVYYPDISWTLSISIPEGNKWMTAIIEEDFMWNFDSNYDTDENCIEFIKLLEFTEEDIKKFIEYNNKYNKEG